MFNDPPLHTRVRRLLVGALNQRPSRAWRPACWRWSTACSTASQSLAEPDLIEDFAARIPVEVIGNLLDVPAAERGPLRDWSLAILSALEPAPDAAGAGTRQRGGRATSRPTCARWWPSAAAGPATRASTC